MKDSIIGYAKISEATIKITYNKFNSLHKKYINFLIEKAVDTEYSETKHFGTGYKNRDEARKALETDSGLTTIAGIKQKYVKHGMVLECLCNTVINTVDKVILVEVKTWNDVLWAISTMKEALGEN